ncbi:hypothetical protein M514_22459, partial [Trichuris suis]
ERTGEKFSPLQSQCCNVLHEKNACRLVDGQMRATNFHKKIYSISTWL